MLQLNTQLNALHQFINDVRFKAIPAIERINRNVHPIGRVISEANRFGVDFGLSNYLMEKHEFSDFDAIELMQLIASRNEFVLDAYWETEGEFVMNVHDVCKQSENTGRAITQSRFNLFIEAKIVENYLSQIKSEMEVNQAVVKEFKKDTF